MLMQSVEEAKKKEKLNLTDYCVTCVIVFFFSK